MGVATYSNVMRQASPQNHILYTFEFPVKSRLVDNAVDNVDNQAHAKPQNNYSSTA